MLCMFLVQCWLSGGPLKLVEDLKFMCCFYNLFLCFGGSDFAMLIEDFLSVS